MAFAADEIPMPPGDPDTLASGVTELKGIGEWLNDSYLITNGNNDAFFDAAWPSGNGATAANGEAHRLIHLLKTGARHTTSGGKALGKYHGTLAAAHKKVAGWHRKWDAAEHTYNTKMRTLDREVPSSSPDYAEFKNSYAKDRQDVQGPILRSYEHEMDDLRRAAHRATHAIGMLFSETLAPGKSIEGSVDDYLLSQLPVTKKALDRQAGIDLANDIKRQQKKHPPNYKKIREDAAQLANQKGNAAFNNAFIRTLGPDGVLQLPYDLERSSDHSKSLKEQQQENGALLTLVADATAGYIGSGPDGTKFGDQLRADAGKDADWAGTDHPERMGDTDLGLLLVAGHNWPPQFLSGAAEDIYRHERQLVKSVDPRDPWGVTDPDDEHRLETSYFSQDAGHGDPMIDALTALGHNDKAAEQFFSMRDSKDKLHYLIKLKEYGLVQHKPGSGTQFTYVGDRGHSLGMALQAASASHDSAATKIVNQVIQTIGGKPPIHYDPAKNTYNPYPGLQPPGMRGYTGKILSNYSSELIDSLMNDGNATFDPGPLRATMRDTFISSSAYHTVLHGVLAEAKARATQAVDSASTYDEAYENLNHIMPPIGHALGEIFNQRGQAITDMAHGADLETTRQADAYKDLAGDVIGVVTGPLDMLGVPIGTEAGDYASAVIDNCLPADQAQKFLDGADARADRTADQSANSVYSSHIVHRLNYLYQQDGAASHYSRAQLNHDLPRNFKYGYTSGASRDDNDTDSGVRWSDSQYTERKKP